MKKQRNRLTRENTELPKMVEKSLKSLVDEEKEVRVEYSPLVKELSGIMSPEDDVNLRDGYTHYLTRKYR